MKCGEHSSPAGPRGEVAIGVRVYGEGRGRAKRALPQVGQLGMDDEEGMGCGKWVWGGREEEEGGQGRVLKNEGNRRQGRQKGVKAFMPRAAPGTPASKLYYQGWQPPVQCLR